MSVDEAVQRLTDCHHSLFKDDVRLVLSELDRLRTENIEIMTLGNDAAAQMCERIAELEALTEPCGICGGVGRKPPYDADGNERDVRCTCGGLGRVPRAPQTERVQIIAFNGTQMFVQYPEREKAHERREWVDGFELDKLVGSGSWETQEGQQQ